MPPIRLVGHIAVSPDRCAAVAAALPVHIRLTRAEPGCRAFDVSPDPDVAGRWQVSELSEERAAFDRHQARVAGSDWGTMSAGLARNCGIEEDAT